MIEKVNPCHPDKVADRIAGALTDLAYSKQKDPKIATEVLIGHGVCHIICETSVEISDFEAKNIVDRLAPGNRTDLHVVPQDEHLSHNQNNSIKCGDNGIFKGMPLTDEQKKLSRIARDIYDRYPSDGKYILADDKLIICQSKPEIQSCMNFIQLRLLIHWANGMAAPMLIQVQPTANLVPIWLTQLLAVVCMARICQRQMFQ